MAWMTAVLLGVVEAIAEFLPISSSAHLYVIGESMHLGVKEAQLYSIAVQLGAACALIVYYRNVIVNIVPCNIIQKIPFLHIKQKEGFFGVHAISILIVATIPAVLAGLLLNTWLDALFTPRSMVFFFVLGALYILVVEYCTRRTPPTTCTLATISMRQALFIGGMQCLSLFSGFSRSTATIMAGLLCGVERKTAVDFSLLLGIPIILGASMLYMLENYMLLLENSSVFLISVGTAFLCSLCTMQWCIPLIKRISYVPFALYRLVVAFLLMLYMI